MNSNPPYQIDISYDTDSKKNIYKLLSINGVLHTIFVSCKICNTTVQSSDTYGLNNPKTLLNRHKCTDELKKIKSFVCSVVKVSQFF